MLSHNITREPSRSRSPSSGPCTHSRPRRSKHRVNSNSPSPSPPLPSNTPSSTFPFFPPLFPDFQVVSSNLNQTDTIQMISVPEQPMNTRENFSAFERVPLEILTEIASNLSIFGKTNLRATCKWFRKSIQTTEEDLFLPMDIIHEDAWLHQFQNHNYNEYFDKEMIRRIVQAAPTKEAAIRQAIRKARETEFLMFQKFRLDNILVDALLAIGPCEIWVKKLSRRIHSSFTFKGHKETLLIVLQKLYGKVSETVDDATYSPRYGDEMDYEDEDDPCFDMALNLHNDDWDMDNLLALILTKDDGKPASKFYSDVDKAYAELEKQSTEGERKEPVMFKYEQLAEKLTDWTDMLRIREFCVEARRTIQQEKDNPPPNHNYCDDDTRMIDLLTPLLKMDRRKVETAMKEARKVNLLAIAERFCKPYHLNRHFEYGGNFNYEDYFRPEDEEEWY